MIRQDNTNINPNTINIAKVTPKDFADFVGDSIFTATFVKKDGSVRVMNCRREVKKHLKGGNRAWDFEKKGFVSVWDLQAEGYRVINCATLIQLNAKGQTLINDSMTKDANLKKIEELAKAIAVIDGGTMDIVRRLNILATTLHVNSALGYEPKAVDGYGEVI